MKTFKTSTYCAAAMLLCTSGLVLSSAAAQQDAPPPPTAQTQGPPAGGPGRGAPDHRLAMLQTELQLSPDQTAQLKQILMDQRAKMEALRSNTTLAPKDMHQQMMAVHEDSETRVHAVLTPEQRTKYDAMVANMRQRGQNRGPGSPPPPPPPPQP